MSVQERIEVLDDDGDFENINDDIANSNSNEQIGTYHFHDPRD